MSSNQVRSLPERSRPPREIFVNGRREVSVEALAGGRGHGVACEGRGSSVILSTVGISEGVVACDGGKEQVSKGSLVTRPNLLPKVTQHKAPMVTARHSSQLS